MDLDESITSWRVCLENSISWTSLILNEQIEIDYLTALIEKSGHQLRTFKCEKNAFLYTLQLSFMKTFKYNMVVTQLDEGTWSKILKQTLIPALHNVGISSSFPKEVLFGLDLLKRFQELMHPYFTREINHSTTLLQGSIQNSQTGLL